MIIRKPTLIAAAFCSVFASSSVLAKITADEAARLGNDLTPIGAEKAANKDGSIPAWTGGITTPPASYKAGMHHPDPYAEDKVLFTIDK